MEKDKLNILMACDSFFPIVDGVTEAMHNYLIELGKTNNVCALAPKLDKKYTDKFPYKVYRCKSIYLPIYKNRYSLPKNDRNLKEELALKNFDIIHVHSPFVICRYATQLAKERGVPVVATFHTKYRDEFQARLKNKKLTEHFMHKIGKALNKVDEVFIANGSLVEELRSYGYRGKTTIMPLGTDFKRNSDSEELSKKANEEFNLNDDEFVFIFIGRIVKVKNIDFTIDALRIVKEKNPNFKFLIAGEGDEMENLKEKVEEYGLSSNVIFIGFVSRDRLPQLYSRSDLLLFPSVFDTFGLIKLEAAAFNTATLTIEDACVSFGIENDKNGYITKYDVNEYANKILEIMQDKQKLKEIGKCAGQTLYHSWEDATKFLLKRYNEIIAESQEKHK